jgi:putative ABC transport system permease protein
MALSQPHTVVLSKLTAEKYFGKEDPMGKTLGLNNNTDFYKVTGVFDKIPANSHFHADMLGSMVGFQPAQSDSWMYGSFFTYLLLKPGHKPSGASGQVSGYGQEIHGTANTTRHGSQP